MANSQELPDWAENRGPHPLTNRPQVYVNAPLAYDDVQARYRGLYEDKAPPGFMEESDKALNFHEGEPKLRADGTAYAFDAAAAMKELHSKKRVAYWAEVFYQSIKVSVQVAMGGVAFDLHVKEPDPDRLKEWRQQERHPVTDELVDIMEAGRGAANVREAQSVAGGGLYGRKEARGHIKALLGYFPDFA